MNCKSSNVNITVNNSSSVDLSNIFCCYSMLTVCPTSGMSFVLI